MWNTEPIQCILEVPDMRKCQSGEFLPILWHKKTAMKDFDREKYRRQIQTNNLIGILLCLSAIAFVIIFWVLAGALKR